MSDPSKYHTIASKPLTKSIDKKESLEVYYLYSMYELSLKSHEAESIHEFCRLVISMALEQLDFERIGILLLSDDLSTMQGTWGTDALGNIIDESHNTAPITDELIPIFEQVQDKGQIVVWQHTDIFDFDQNNSGSIEKLGKGWNAAFAFWMEDRPIGWIAADNMLKQKEFTPLQQQIFRMLGDLVGEFIRNQRQNQKINSLNYDLLEEREHLQELNQKLKHLTLHDELTGLHNRRYLFDAFELECSRASRDPDMISCLMIDIDHFKLVNDNYGHQFGDDTLVAVADCLRQSVRSYDILTRFGGEEFCIVMMVKNSEEVETITQRILENIYNIKLTFEERKVTISASLGVFSCPAKVECKLDKLIKQADLMLYQAKNNGRNRVEINQQEN
ncbi:MAG: GGDEF domain-containing protein [Psychromonas sp.]|nr:GGDEF domain-containing protein [Alteromonadales bacterium]MCP5079025.1 GGDEF domain-containing protein [Psychromonas sp.]